jgi:hypothetical protein
MQGKQKPRKQYQTLQNSEEVTPKKKLDQSCINLNPHILSPEYVWPCSVESAVLDMTPIAMYKKYQLPDLPHPAALFSGSSMTLDFPHKEVVNLEWKWLALREFLTRQHSPSAGLFDLPHFLQPIQDEEENSSVQAQGPNHLSAEMTHTH